MEATISNFAYGTHLNDEKWIIEQSWQADLALLVTFYSALGLTIVMYALGAGLLRRSLKKEQRAQLELFQGSTLTTNSEFDYAADRTRSAERRGLL